MDFFFWRTNKKHDEFSSNLAQQFILICPLDLVENMPNKKAQIKYNKALNMLNSKAKDYRINAKLGIYSKARIGNKFMWALRSQGYNYEFVNNLTNLLLHSLSGKK